MREGEGKERSSISASTTVCHGFLGGRCSSVRKHIATKDSKNSSCGLCVGIPDS